MDNWTFSPDFVIMCSVFLSHSDRWENTGRKRPGKMTSIETHNGEKIMTYEEAVKTIRPGRYRHFKGNEYEVIGIARHSETEEPMVVYRALYGEGCLWTRPADMWNETVERDGHIYRRFCRLA